MDHVLHMDNGRLSEHATFWKVNQCKKEARATAVRLESAAKPTDENDIIFGMRFIRVLM